MKIKSHTKEDVKDITIKNKEVYEIISQSIKDKNESGTVQQGLH